MRWEEIKERACESHDEHVIKLVYSCWQEHLAYDNPAYIAAAEQVVADEG